jgi:hypothetical protein
MLYDKNYIPIREHDEVILDCDSAEFIKATGQIKCIVCYDTDWSEMILFDTQGNTYKFDVNSFNISCPFVEVVVKKDSDTGCLI